MTVEEARMKFCPELLGPDLPLSRCLGDNCMAWHWNYEDKREFGNLVLSKTDGYCVRCGNA